MKGDLWLLRIEDRHASPPPQVDGLRLFHAIDAAASYAYASAPLSDDWLPLSCILDLAGAAAGRPAPVHYVVETDVLPEHEADFNDWYDQEHLAGLAAVPGTVRASRYLIDGGTPRYHACYELVSPDVFDSPEWRAVRATAWSSRVRPAFRNTRRTMFTRA